MKRFAVSAAVVAAIGAALAGWESGGKLILQPYLDPVGVLTVCDGITGDDVIIGKTYTEAECAALNQKHAREHAESVVRLCGTATLDAPLHVQFAVYHLAYNTGAGAVCGNGSKQTTIKRELTLGNYTAVCDAIEQRYFRAGGKDCRDRSSNCFGIIRRRQWEAAVCRGEVQIDGLTEPARN